MEIGDYLDSEGNIAIPEGSTLLSHFHRNVAELGETTAYRYLDYEHDGQAIELTWAELDTKVRAIGARLQQVTSAGIGSPSSPAGRLRGRLLRRHPGRKHRGAVVLPELPGHAERLDAVLADAAPTVVLTTTAAAEAVGRFLRKLPRSRRPRMMAMDAVPDSVGADFRTVPIATDDIAYLQYTSGSTRTPPAWRSPTGARAPTCCR